MSMEGGDGFLFRWEIVFLSRVGFKKQTRTRRWPAGAGNVFTPPEIIDIRKYPESTIFLKLSVDRSGIVEYHVS